MSENRKRKVVVLGCGGFIGSHLIKKILATTNWQIEGVDVTSRKITHLLDNKRLSVHTMDIHDVTALRQVIEKSSVIISLAALCNPYLYTHTPIDVIESNFVRMYPLVKTCSELGCRLIHFSTSEVYGRTLGGSISGEEIGDNPSAYILDELRTPLLLGPIRAQRWNYACAKQLLERTIFAYGFEHDLDYTIIRPFNFIGPHMDFLPGIDGEGVPRVIACFMDALFHDKPLQLVDGGMNRRCFTAIDDAVDATVRILERPEVARQKIFNIGNPDNETTIAELAKRMIILYSELSKNKMSKDSNIENVTSSSFYGEGYEDSDRRVPDITSATKLLEWKPKIGLDDALRLTIDGFIREYQNGRNIVIDS